MVDRALECGWAIRLCERECNPGRPMSAVASRLAWKAEVALPIQTPVWRKGEQ